MVHEAIKYYHFSQTSKRRVITVGTAYTAQYRPIPPNTAQYRPIPPNTAQYRPIPPNTAQYRPIPPNTAKYRQIPPNTAKYRQIPPNTTYLAVFGGILSPRKETTECCQADDCRVRWPSGSLTLPFQRYSKVKREAMWRSVFAEYHR